MQKTESFDLRTYFLTLTHTVYCNAILHDSIPPDGEWDWDNYSVVYLSQKKDLPVTAMASVKFNVWCAIGNSIFVVHSHLLKMEVCVCVTLQTILCF